MSKSEEEVKMLKAIAQFTKEDKYEQSLQVCNELIDQDSNCYSAYSARADVLYHLGKYTEAFQDIDRLMYLRPDSPSAYVRRAEWNLAQGNDKLVIDDLSFVIKSKDQYYLNVAYFYSTVALLNLGKKAEALEACRKLPDGYEFYVETYHAGGRLLSRDALDKMILCL